MSKKPPTMPDPATIRAGAIWQDPETGSIYKRSSTTSGRPTWAFLLPADDAEWRTLLWDIWEWPLYSAIAFTCLAVVPRITRDALPVPLGMAMFLVMAVAAFVISALAVWEALNGFHELKNYTRVDQNGKAKSRRAQDGI